MTWGLNVAERAEKLIAQGRLDAERLGKELQVIRIGWRS
jgi:hypothetical protein